MSNINNEIWNPETKQRTEAYRSELIKYDGMGSVSLSEFTDAIEKVIVGSYCKFNRNISFQNDQLLRLAGMSFLKIANDAKTAEQYSQEILNAIGPSMAEQKEISRCAMYVRMAELGKSAIVRIAFLIVFALIYYPWLNLFNFSQGISEFAVLFAVLSGCFFCYGHVAKLFFGKFGWFLTAQVLSVLIPVATFIIQMCFIMFSYYL